MFIPISLSLSLSFCSLSSLLLILPLTLSTRFGVLSVLVVFGYHRTFSVSNVTKCLVYFLDTLFHTTHHQEIKHTRTVQQLSHRSTIHCNALPHLRWQQLPFLHGEPVLQRAPWPFRPAGPLLWQENVDHLAHQVVAEDAVELVLAELPSV